MDKTSTKQQFNIRFKFSKDVAGLIDIEKLEKNPSSTQLKPDYERKIKRISARQLH